MYHGNSLLPQSRNLAFIFAYHLIGKSYKCISMRLVRLYFALPIIVIIFLDRVDKILHQKIKCRRIRIFCIYLLHTIKLPVVLHTPAQTFIVTLLSINSCSTFTISCFIKGSSIDITAHIPINTGRQFRSPTLPYSQIFNILCIIHIATHKQQGILWQTCPVSIGKSLAFYFSHLPLHFQQFCLCRIIPSILHSITHRTIILCESDILSHRSIILTNCRLINGSQLWVKIIFSLFSGIITPVLLQTFIECFLSPMTKNIHHIIIMYRSDWTTPPCADCL